MAPTPSTFLYAPGDPAVLQAGPLLPSEKIGMMPAANHASVKDVYQGSPPPPPQELLITCGALLQSGSLPSTLVGQVRNSAELVKSKSEQKRPSHPCAAI